MSLELTEKLSSIAKELGADLFGIADLRPVKEFVVAQGGEQLGIFSRLRLMSCSVS